MALPFFVVMDDDLGLMVDFDNVHITKRLRNSFLAGNIIITDVPLTPQTLQALGKHVNIDIDDVISRGKADRQKFRLVHLFIGSWLPLVQSWHHTMGSHISEGPQGKSQGSNISHGSSGTT